MPDLLYSLQGRDLGHLRIIAELWGIDLDAPDARIGGQRLAERLLEGDLIEDVLAVLPENALNALADLLQNEGRLPWAGFTRRYGVLREMGPARRDREKPYLDENASPTEALYYRGLVGRAFFDTPNGAEEFGYIPDDLMALLPDVAWQEAPSLGRPASPIEKAVILPASDRILDDACTLLAGLRLGLPLEAIAPDLQTGIETTYPLTPGPLCAMLFSAGILDINNQPLPDPTRQFLEAPRPAALAMLARAWLRSQTFNELRLMPGVSAEGVWQNDPLRTRGAILDFLSTIPGGQAIDDASSERPFWSLSSFISAIKQEQPDFQREAGDYDSWHLRDLATSEFLRGFEHWDQVEGAVVRFMAAGPLHWLGVLDLAALAEPAGDGAKRVTAFRYSPWSMDLLDGLAPQPGAAASALPENEGLLATSDGRLRVPMGVPLAARYQMARLSQWSGVKDGVYQYRLTPTSLSRAREQGLKFEHLLTLLRRHTRALPPTLVRALQRWEANGAEARLEQVTVLRLRTPELLAEVRASRAGRFLGEPLGPTSVIIKPGAAEKVLLALAELGYLGEEIG